MDRILADRYELLTHIARGGMSDVYEARDRLLGRRVAVKVLHSRYSSDEAFVKRFRREAQAAANLTHPNIVSIFDWGEDGGTYFIVMELVDGRSLRDILKEEGRLLPRRAVEIAAEVAAALAVAHRAGIVHRDVKPGNILITPDGTVKVTDFGIARAFDDSSELTRTGAVIGTATYFSPEQAQGLPADERSDVYSLGVVLYEMVAGRPPFQGESPVAVAYQHVSEPVTPPSLYNPDVPPEVEQVILKALEKDPSRRFQTADEMREALLRILQGRSELVPTADAPTQVMAGSPLPPPTMPPDGVYRAVEARPPSQVPFILTAFGLLVALGIGLFLLISRLGAAPAGPEVVTVPDVVGMAEAEALLTLQREGLIVQPFTQSSDTVPEGFVIATDPPAGTEVEADSVVRVIISIGPEGFPVPPVIGETLEEATRLLRENGFEVGEVVEQADDRFAAGLVIEQDPAPGASLPPGSTVDLVVSTGPERIVLEDFTGRTLRDVQFQLETAGIVVEIVEEFSDEVPEGRVIRTEPEPGTEVRRGETVVVVVSQGPEPVLVPDLIGQTPEQADATLTELGLVLRVSAGRVPVGPELDGRVAEQFPDPGTEVPKGTIVTVTLGEAPTTTTTTSGG